MYYIRYEVDWKYQIKQWLVSAAHFVIVGVASFIMGMGVVIWLLQ
jgi:hypothetical protein